MKTPEEIQAINIVRVAANNISLLTGRLNKLQSDEKGLGISRIIQDLADSINWIAKDLLHGNKQDFGYEQLVRASLKYPAVLGYQPGDYQQLSFTRYLPNAVGVSSSDHDGDVREAQKV